MAKYGQRLVFGLILGGFLFGAASAHAETVLQSSPNNVSTADQSNWYDPSIGGHETVATSSAEFNGHWTSFYFPYMSTSTISASLNISVLMYTSTDCSTGGQNLGSVVFPLTSDGTWHTNVVQSVPVPFPALSGIHCLLFEQSVNSASSHSVVLLKDTTLNAPDGAAMGIGSFILDGQIDWNAYYSILPFSSTTVSIATSSGLWSSYSASSTLTAIGDQCALSGNIFSEAICVAMAYLFVPNPTVLNSYTSLVDSINSRFPASWVVGVRGTFASLTASTTANFIVLRFPLHGMASTSPFGDFLPDVTVLSTSTIYAYISPTTWDWLQELIKFGLWLGLVTDIFFYVRNHMHKV